MREYGYQLGPVHWLKPDVSITYPDQPVEDYLIGAPLLAVEVVSPSNTAAEIEAKIDDYRKFGAREVWVVYPDSRHIWVFGKENRCHSGSFRSELLGGELIDIDQILAE